MKVKELGIKKTEILIDYDYVWGLLNRSGLNVSFSRPEIYVGSEHVDKFFEIASQKSLVVANSTEAVYDWKADAIYINDELINGAGYSRSNLCSSRRLVLLHELIHAFLFHNNKRFGEEQDALTKSENKRSQERGWVYTVFDEGFAIRLTELILTFWSDVQDGEFASSLALILKDEYRELKSDKDFRLRALILKLPWPESGWKKVALRWFEKHPHGLYGLSYVLGYNFTEHIIQDLNKNSIDMVSRIVETPPSRVEHILYPQRYLSQKVFPKMQKSIGQNRNPHSKL
ncbi:MAG: hypothetical protein HYW77_00330 [Parcubacteria group bacterium]|nr:hypothetical protein [Parcubacteria group bacterium]